MYKLLVSILHRSPLELMQVISGSQGIARKTAHPTQALTYCILDGNSSVYAPDTGSENIVNYLISSSLFLHFFRYINGTDDSRLQVYLQPN